MKKGLFYLGILIASLVFLTSFSIRENPQEPIRGGKKHITMVKVEDGKESKLDTIVEAGKVFVWKGDSVGGDLKWISEDDINIHSDSLGKFGKFEYVIKTGDDKEGKKVVMFMSDDCDTEKLHEFLIKDTDGENLMFFGDNGKTHKLKGAKSAVWVTDEGDDTIIKTPHVIKATATPGSVKVIREKSAGTVIELNDPNIISFKKKKLSGGREKIEIIRKEVPEDEKEINVVIEKTGDAQSEVFLSSPHISKELKIITGEDGVFSIFEGDGEEHEFTDEDGNLIKVKEIKKGDGSIINIKEIKEGDAKKVKVTVTEDVKKEKKED
ncbi:MAG: hypothetical protein JW833_02490 [Prolixibacteraceae bacterium]|nr:hypothetical protein [Prolixibacteraceae bacterium]